MGACRARVDGVGRLRRGRAGGDQAGARQAGSTARAGGGPGGQTGLAGRAGGVAGGSGQGGRAGLSGPLANLAVVYERTQRVPLAIKTMRNSQRADYHNLVGVWHRHQGEFKEARQAYEQALALDPDYAPAQLNLGILWDIYLQEPDRALGYYQRYQQLVPAETATITKWMADIEQRKRAAERKPKQEVKG